MPRSLHPRCGAALALRLDAVNGGIIEEARVAGLALMVRQAAYGKTIVEWTVFDDAHQAVLAALGARHWLRGLYFFSMR